MSVDHNPFDRHFDSLESIADTISEVVQCPVTIEDASHKLLAYSSHDPETDPARIATIIGRRVPENVISALWKEGIIQQIMTSHEPIRISQISEVGLGDRIAIAIRNNQDVLGYIYILDNNQRTNETSLQLLQQAAQAARTKLVQLQTQNRKQEQHNHDFFWHLLTHANQSEPETKERASQLGIALPPRYQVIVLEFESDINDKLNQQIQYTIRTVQQIRIALHVIHNNRLIMMCAPGVGKHAELHYKDECSKFITQLKLRFGAVPVRRGGGLFYEQYVSVEKSYQEALVVIQMRNKYPEALSGINDYNELGYYRYLPTLVVDRERKPIINENLNRLWQYDDEHNSDLLYTLEIFLNQDSNVKKAAEVLHVHTNTLMYRLKRIMEIGDIDLNNMDQKVTMYLELKLNKWK
ncbi:helix-turn-helix domain-containing protein [Paenibacillus sp. ACRRX]|uniref:PucR family transcriptional regulator n=1 Tax=unclassified Paenibacillus TaxID=185978 RepID=UPI001EF514B5|nr:MULTISPECIES: helix-turn-helix domain-containing protein [unclassified Paenibacillus]MCG7406189.1 helix-turn-helix domain-containing protein [Paenibacillus sp. ACRRX]MDK8179222.1 helix-turn-helix domain-containing protein [Paenibacillus sp. UMB4589-SE434]